MEQHVRRLTDEQRRMGHRVALIFAEGASTHADDWKIASWPFHAIRPQSLRVVLFFLGSIRYFLGRRGSFEVVHVHGDWSMAVGGWILKRLIGARTLMLSVHDGPGYSPARAWLQRRAFRLPDLLHATGRREAREFQIRLRQPVLWQASGISDVFLTGLDRPGSANRRSTETPLVVIAAVMRPKKNLDLALDIASKMQDVHFAILGDGPERARLQRRVADDGLHNVHMPGRCDHREVREWLDRASVFLCTSRVEGTPTAVLEAMARGVPVVTSDCSDFSGIVDTALNGYVIDGFEAGDFVSALRKVMSDVPRWQEMSHACRERARAFSWARIASSITSQMSGVDRAPVRREQEGRW
jgi:glycosyltransferase involved in cell wall biosynthesis